MDGLYTDSCPLVKTGPYWNEKHSLDEADGLLFKENIIIPVKMRPEMLKLIYQGHFGIEKTKARARQLSTGQVCQTTQWSDLKVHYMQHIWAVGECCCDSIYDLFFDLII
jgi:hypothetical protein